MSDVEPTPLEGHELFVAVLAQIEREPESWNQRAWAVRAPCGTSYCMAGHAVVLSGHVVDWNNATPAWETEEFPAGAVVNNCIIGGAYIEDTAAELLGLTPDEADTLFRTWNSLDDLYRISAEHMGIDIDVLKEKVRSVVAGSDLTP